MNKSHPTGPQYKRLYQQGWRPLGDTAYLAWKSPYNECWYSPPMAVVIEARQGQNESQRQINAQSVASNPASDD